MKQICLAKKVNKGHMRTVLFVLCLFALKPSSAVTLDDEKCDNLQLLCIKENAKYIIRNHHLFNDTLIIPYGSELYFDGGSISGAVVFDYTKLSGKVNLKGANIKGNIQNKVFNASWLCSIDGVKDDAPCINQIIEVCGFVLFPKGKYRLVSAFDPKDKVDKIYNSAIKTHIGIGRSNVKLMGEEGAEFITSEPLGTICVFSKLHQIDKSVRNITIQGITFTVNNDGHDFYPYMHTIKTMGVDGMIIKNCKFNDFWGDAICLSHFGDTPQTGERTRNRNVTIKNNTIIGGVLHNNRNGISVINGQNITIQNNIIKNTSRKDMPGGIDVEPNNSAYTIDEIRILNNFLEGIKTCAISIYIPKGAPAYNIKVKDNVIKKSGTGITIGVLSNNNSENFVIKGNRVDELTTPYKFMGEGNSVHWVISNNIFERPCLQGIPGDIKVEDIVVKNNKKKR